MGMADSSRSPRRTGLSHDGVHDPPRRRVPPLARPRDGPLPADDGPGLRRVGHGRARGGLPPLLPANPFEGGFAVACGLARALEYLEDFRFAREDLDYLAGLAGQRRRAALRPRVPRPARLAPPRLRRRRGARGHGRVPVRAARPRHGTDPAGPARRDGAPQPRQLRDAHRHEGGARRPRREGRPGRRLRPAPGAGPRRRAHRLARGLRRRLRRDLERARGTPLRPAGARHPRPQLGDGVRDASSRPSRPTRARSRTTASSSSTPTTPLEGVRHAIEAGPAAARARPRAGRHPPRLGRPRLPLDRGPPHARRGRASRARRSSRATTSTSTRSRASRSRARASTCGASARASSPAATSPRSAASTSSAPCASPAASGAAGQALGAGGQDLEPGRSSRCGASRDRAASSPT